MWPVLINTAAIKIYSYPLLMGIAWGMAYQISLALLNRQKISSKGFQMLFWGAFVISWIGAKVFFLFYSSGEEFINYAGSSYFWLGGGFVFYGGFIFGLIYIALYCLLFKKFNFSDSHILIPGLGIGHAIGRIGCFLAGCCYGKICDLPWAIHLHGEDRHPVQLYESIFLVLLSLITYKMIRDGKKSMKVVATYFVSYSIIRFFLEFLRGDLIRGVHAFSLSTSQYVSIGILVLAIILRWRNKEITQR